MQLRSTEEIVGNSRHMWNVALVLVVMTQAIALHSPLDAQDARDARSSGAPGVLWGQFDDAERMVYARGFIDGAVATEVLVENFVRQAGETGAILVPGTEDRFREAVVRIIQDVISGTMSVEMKPFVDAITRLYANPLNECVPFFTAAYLSLRGVRGGVDDDEAARRLLEARASFPSSC